MQDTTTVTPVQKGSTNPKAYKQKEKLVRLRTPLSLAEQAETRLRLSNALQSSLDLRRVLEVFFHHAIEQTGLGGMEYSNAAKEINISLGKVATHQCNYRLITQSDNFGELTFSRSRRFGEDELATLELMISSLIFPLRNSLQYRDALQTAMRDPLTGIGNRAALDNALHRELRMAERYQQELSLLVVDIDHFKTVNDTHGHACGDEVLKQVAEAIIGVTRQTDMTFRYGGEEFVVVLSKTELEGATTIAERIRNAIEDATFSCQGGEIHTTVSVGVSSLKEKENIQHLFDRADRALYRAKREGRNRVISEND